MMTSQLCSVIQHSAPWIGAVAVLVTFASLFFYILLFLFFISLLLILSASTIFTLSKKNRIVAKKTVKDTHSEEVEVEDLVKVASTMCTRSLQEEQECQEEESEVHEVFSSEDSDFDSPYKYSWSQELTDGSISDEESLIEIALPSGHYVSSPEFELPPLSAEEMFKQHGLMELLAEFNEENLIEIDISMGSIMCPRFEIKA